MVDASWRFAGNYARTFANAFAHHFASGFGKDLLKYFVLDFAGNFARGFASKFAVGFATYFSSDFKAEFTRQFANEILGKFAIRSSSPAGSPGYAGVPVPEIWMHDQGQPHIRFKESLASTTGEAWIALATMSLSESGDKKSGYLLFRIQNRWLFNVWSAIDRRLPENPTPAQLALYFALGWTQSTTTWVWPKSERWRMLFAAGPGENWLVRSQWHLCRLTDNPDSASSRAALREALRDGRNDEALLGYADRLAELLGIEQ